MVIKEGLIIMTNTQYNNLGLVNKICEEVNETFYHLVEANITTKGNIQLSLKTRKYVDEYEVEEQLSGVFEYVAEKFNVDFTIINYYKRALIVEVDTY